MYISSLRVKNYKALSSISIDDARLINIIGGKNSVGKTSLTEAIFLVSDGMNPLSFTRPSSFRGLNGPELNSFLSLQGANNALDKGIEISAATSHGSLQCRLGTKLEKISFGPSAPTTFTKSDIETNVTTTGTYNFDYEFKIDGQTHLEASINGTSGGTFMQVSHQIPAILPRVCMVNHSTMSNIQDLTTRYTALRDEGLESTLIKELSSLNVDAAGLVISNRVGFISLDVRLRNGKTFPVQFFGSGFNVLLAILLAIFDAKGGAVLIDEFDASIHYSALEDVWSRLISYAQRFDTQIFVASHSYESIGACFRAAAQTNSISLVAYHRLIHAPKRSGIAVSSYHDETLAIALEQEAELR